MGMGLGFGFGSLGMLWLFGCVGLGWFVFVCRFCSVCLFGCLVFG